MPKRKRAEPTGSPPTEAPADRSLGRRKKLCIQRLAAAQKPLLDALRHAASLERQKHSRRKKTAQANKDAKAVVRLDAEYAHLKALELDKVAEQLLRKTIAKVKSLKDNECLPESVRQIEKGNNDPALLNVKGRLFKVDAVRKAVDEVIDDLKEIVGAGGVIGKEQGEGDRHKKAKMQEEEDEAFPEDAEYGSDAFAALDALIAAPSSAEGDSEDSLSDGHRPPSEEDMGSEEDEDDDDLSDAIGLPGADATILPSHDLSDEEESGATSSSGVVEDLEVESACASDEASIPLPKAKRKALVPAKVSDSTFIPALSHAAYFFNSDSEASDLDEEIAPRKNRRGQKARQKIWEAKFKDKAKHLQKQERIQGWDPKRGAVGDRSGRNGRPTGRGPEQSGANEQPLGPKKTKKDDVGELHPSWQAAKAAKEKKMSVKPQGTKVVFD